MRSAARLDVRLLDALERLDDGRLPIAEVARRLGGEAERLGRPRPSYERVRQLVHDLRLDRADTGPSRAELVVEVTSGLISRDRFWREYGEAEERAERRKARRGRRL